MASDHSGIVQQIEQVIEKWRSNSRVADANSRRCVSLLDQRQCVGVAQAYDQCAKDLSALSAVLVSLPAPERPQTVDEIMGRCLCGLQATTTVPMWRGMSLSVCERCKTEAAALSLGLVNATPAPDMANIRALLKSVSKEHGRHYGKGPHCTCGEAATAEGLSLISQLLAASVPASPEPETREE